MGLLRRLADYFEPVEERSIDPSWAALGSGLDGGSITPHAAENLSTVLACITAISSAIASLPALVYRTEANGRRIDEAHPVSRLIDLGPNVHQSSCDFIEWLLASCLLRGNALAEIVSNGRGAITALKPVPWQHVNVRLLANGRLAYDVTDFSAIGGTGRVRRLLQDQVLHLRDRSDDGVIGRSRLHRAAAVIRAGMSIQTFANSLFDNSVMPSGALEVDEQLSADNRAALASRIKQLYAGPKSAGKILILDQGLSWKTISMSPEDAEFLASRKFTTEELCRLFNVPPVIVGDLSNSSFNNTETLTRFHAQSCLSPWIKKLESEFARSVLTPGWNLEIDLSGLLRGDPQQRWESWKIAVEAGILDPDEVRLEEGFNPRPRNAAVPATVSA